MYCIQCGMRLPEGSKFCSNCGCQLASTESSLTYRPSKEPELDKMLIGEIYTNIYQLADSISSEFVGSLDSKYHNLDNFMQQGFLDVREIFSCTEDYALKLLRNKKIYHYGTSEVLHYTRKYMGYTSEVLTQLQLTYNKIVGVAQTAMQASESLKNNRSRIIGGGFGIAGTVKGMAFAGAVNTAIGVFHSYTANLREGSIRKDLRTQKAELFCSSQFREALSFSIELDIKESIHGICDLFSDLSLGHIPFYPLDNLLKAGNILDSIAEGKVPSSEIPTVAQQIIDMYPVHRDKYLYAAEICPERKKQYFSLAQDYGINIYEYFKDIDAQIYPFAKRLADNIITQILFHANVLDVDVKKDVQVLYSQLHELVDSGLGFGCVCNVDFENQCNKMRKSFAQYGDSEIPIIFFDISKLNDGTRGFLLTNESLYIRSQQKWMTYRGPATFSTVDFDYRIVGGNIFLETTDGECSLPVDLDIDETELLICTLDFFLALLSFVQKLQQTHYVTPISNGEFLQKLISLTNIQELSGELKDLVSNDDNFDNNDDQSSLIGASVEIWVSTFDSFLADAKIHPTYYQTNNAKIHAAIQTRSRLFYRDWKKIKEVYTDFNENFENLIFYSDSTIGGTFKESFLLTDQYFHCHSNRYGSWKITYSAINSVTVEGDLWPYLAINGRRVPFLCSDGQLTEFAHDLENIFVPFFEYYGTK